MENDKGSTILACLQKRTLEVLIKMGINNKWKLQKYLLYHTIDSLLEVKNFGLKSLGDLKKFCIINKIKYYY